MKFRQKFYTQSLSSSFRGVLGFVYFLFCISSFTAAQQINWTGNIDKISLFNNANWFDTGTNTVFAGNLASNVPINRNVYFGLNSTIGTDKEVKGIFDAGTGFIKFYKTNIRTDYAGVSGFKSGVSITLDSAILLTGFVNAPQIIVTGNSQLHLYETDAISADTKIDIIGEDAWVFFHMLTPQQVIDRYVKQIYIDGVASIPASNCRITQYYDGTVVIPHRASVRAMYLYSGANLTGLSKFFRVSYSSGTNIGVNNTNKAASMLLKKGYMAVIAQNQNGTGPNKVYIAEDSDIIINGKINGKNDTVQFVRVTPWRWISKKGIGGTMTDFNAAWSYNWSPGLASTVDKEFVPMQWGTWNIDANAETLKTKGDVTHLLGFNEPDGKDQANMTIAQCLNLWPKLMLTGLRLGSPAFVKTDSLYKFMDRALTLGYRVDFMCMHSYEKRTGDNYVNTIYKPLWDKYQIPIWVTEFSYGAPWNTTTSDKMLAYNNGNKDFTVKMDAAPFIERYALFAWSNPVTVTDSLFYSFEKFVGSPTGVILKSVLSPRGIQYRDFESLPSRGNPLIYRAKISQAKQELIDLALAAEYNDKCFSFISRNNDGVSRRKIQISTSASKLNTAFIGGDGTATASATESFLFVKVADNRYRLKVNNNCLFLSVRNDSVVVETQSSADKQIWELVSITGTSFVALKNVGTGKFINPVNNSVAIATLLTTINSDDISSLRSAHWQITASSVCNCTDPTLGVFDMKVEPMTGEAPLTVKMSGSKLTKESKDAFYRWYIFQETDTLVSTFYNQEYTYTKPGTYRIQVRGRDYITRNTVKDYTITVTAPSGFKNAFEKNITISPNPVQETIFISGIEIGEKVVIYDTQGRMVLQQIYNGSNISIDFLPSGFYILSCNGYAPVKLLKK